MTADSVNQGVHDLRVGDTFESFQIVQRISATNSSILWKGYDRLLDRHVAIKQLIVATSDPNAQAMRRRFGREASAMKSLATNQKHLVGVIDLIDQPRGLFIVMAYVDGPSLKQLLAQMNGPLDGRQALGIVGAAALGLAAIHQRGLIHRDLKPANILLPRAGGLKLVDFGLLTLLPDQEVTTGSVRYMAPELFGSGPADPCSDLYALGMIAYEMLAGRHAFHEAFRAVLRDSRNLTLRWMKWHTNRRSKPPALDQLNPHVDATVSELVASLMEKDPSRRIRSADELMGVIRRHCSRLTGVVPQDAAVTATALPTASAALGGDIAPTAPLPARRRLPIVLGILLTLQLLAAAGIVGYFMLQEQAGERQLVQIASQRFNEARELFANERYDAASRGFQALAQQWPGHRTYGQTATAYVAYCGAMIAWENEQFTQALDLLDQVDGMQVFENRDKIQEDRHRIDHDRGFTQLLSEIRARSDDGDHLDALAKIQRIHHVSLSTVNRQRLDELARLLQSRRSREQIGQIRAQVEALTAKGKHQEAIDLVGRLQQRRNVSVDELGTMRHRILDDQKLTQLRQQAQTEQMRPQPDLNVAIRLLTMAGAMKDKAGTSEDHQAVLEQLRTLQSEKRYREGYSAEMGDKLETAKNNYKAAIQIHDHTKAAAGLERIAQVENRNQLIKKGNQALQRGDYEIAIKEYGHALEQGAAGPAVGEPLFKARLALRLRDARQFTFQNKIPEARRAYEDLLRMKPDHTDAAKALAKLAAREQYMKFVEQAQQLTLLGQHSKAKLKYMSARQIIPTPQVTRWIEDAEFQDLMGKVCQAIDEHAWRRARALLRTAGDTPTGQRQVDQVSELWERIPDPLSEVDDYKP